MIEQMVRDYLIRKTKIPAFMEKEPDMPKEYFLIEKTGSGKDNHIRQATLAIKSYSTSLYQAAVLNEKLKAAMENIIEINEVSRCSLNSDYPYSDTSRKEYRYQAVFDITHY